VRPPAWAPKSASRLHSLPGTGANYPSDLGLLSLVLLGNPAPSG